MFLLDCKLTREGTEYKGTKAVSKSGKPCLSWLRVNNENRFDGRIENSENFCRNYGSLRPYGPWCFTSLDAAREWEYCNIPYCDVSISTGKKKAHTQLCLKNELNR